MTFPQRMNIKADRYKSFDENMLNPNFVYLIKITSEYMY